MATELGYTAGWFDSSVHDFLEELPKAFPSMQSSLITCLDSNPDPGGAFRKSPKLRALLPDARVLARGLIIPTARLLDINRRGEVFFGFDEIWFFPARPETPKPESVHLVGPERIDPETLRRVAPWMRRMSCSLGLGDGTGLNVATKAHGLIRYLMAHSVSQPASHT